MLPKEAGKTRSGDQRNDEKIGRSRIQTKPEKMPIFQERSRLDWAQNRPERNTTLTRQTGSNNKNCKTEKRKRIKILLGGDTILIKVYRKSVCADRCSQKTTEETKQVGMDRRTYKRLQQSQKTNNPITIPSTL